jgi:hypothetical protein
VSHRNGTPKSRETTGYNPRLGAAAEAVLEPELSEPESSDEETSADTPQIYYPEPDLTAVLATATAAQDRWPYPESAIISYALDLPDKFQVAIGLIKPEFFQLFTTRYVMAWILNLHEKYGEIPTREALRGVIVRHLTTNDPYEDVLKVVERESDPRETGIIRDQLLEWVTSRVYERFYDEDVVRAVQRGDYAAVENIFNAAKQIKSDAAVSDGDLPNLRMLQQEEYEESWLVENVLLAGQPIVIGGRKKVLKTGILCDLAASIATGGKFLGKFQAVKQPVVFVSGETGQQDIIKRMKAIAKCRNLNFPDDLDDLRLCFKRIKLSKPGSRDWLLSKIAKIRPGLVIIDPLYRLMGLGGGEDEASPSNLYQMGDLLDEITDACQKTGGTLLLSHHFKKSAPDNLDLDNLAYSGLAEFARQSILIRRSQEFTTPKLNNLLIQFHRQGNGETYSVVVDEGDDSGSWRISLETASELAKNQRDLKRNQLIGRVVAAINDLTAEQPDKSASQRDVREHCGMSGETARKAIDLAVEDGYVELYETRINGQLSKCVRLVS